jgi:hypothetical protein
LNETITAITVYEAPSFGINNLRPAGIWKGRVVDENGSFIADAYRPLESFIKRSDGSVFFSPAQPLNIINQKNYGGNIQNAIMPYIDTPTGVDPQDVRNAIISNIQSSDILNINTLYYLQVTDFLSKEFESNGGGMESLTLHFE